MNALQDALERLLDVEELAEDVALTLSLASSSEYPDADRLGLGKGLTREEADSLARDAGTVREAIGKALDVLWRMSRGMAA